MGFPFHIYENSVKFVLIFPALQFCISHFLFALYQKSAKFCAGQCLWALLLTASSRVGVGVRTERIEDGETIRKKDFGGKRELSKHFWKQLAASCYLTWAFVFNVSNSVTSLFIQFCEPDPALKLLDTCLSILPGKASIMEMKLYYQKAKIKLKG